MRAHKWYMSWSFARLFSYNGVEIYRYCKELWIAGCKMQAANSSTLAVWEHGRKSILTQAIFQLKTHTHTSSEPPWNSASFSSFQACKSAKMYTVGGASQCINTPFPFPHITTDTRRSFQPFSCLILPQCPSSPSYTPLITYSVCHKTQEIIQLVHSTHIASNLLPLVPVGSDFSQTLHISI